LIGSAAPIAAFMATKGGGRTGPAPRKRPERSGGWRRAAILLRDAKRASSCGLCEQSFVGARRKIAARRHCGAGPLAAKRRLSRRPVARPFPDGEPLHDPHAPLRPRPPLADPIGHQHEARDVLREELDSDCSPNRIEA